MLHDLAFRARALFRADVVEADLEDELRAELEQEVEFLLHQGIPLEEARRQARLRFGPLEQIKERCREARGVLWLETAWQDLVYAARLLRKNLVLNLVVMVALAIGIGSNGAALSLWHALTHTMAAGHSNQLATVVVGFSKPGFEQYTAGVPQTTVDHLMAWQHSFSSISCWFFPPFNAEDEQGALRFYPDGAGVRGGMELLEITPVLGRVLTAADDLPRPPGGRWAIVLGYRFWRERFRGDPNIIGRDIVVSGEPATVVGVTPKDSAGFLMGQTIRLFMPMRLAARAANVDEQQLVVRLLGRLRPGVTAAMADSELARFTGPIDLSILSVPQLTAAAGPYLKMSAGQSVPTSVSAPGGRRMMLLTGTLVGIVFLLCGTNVAGLVLGRRYLREHEFSMRAVLGGARRRLYRQYWTEGLLLALATLPLALLVAWSIAFLLQKFLTFESPGPVKFHADSSLFPITAFLAFAAVVVFGIIPGLCMGRGSIINPFRQNSPRANKYLRTAFAILQVALSLLLLNLASLFGSNLARLRAQHLGFDPQHVIIQSAVFQDLAISKEELVHLYQTMTNQLVQMPGIESATVTWYTPVYMFSNPPDATFIAADGDYRENKQQDIVYNYVGPGYFQTLTMNVREGREFDFADQDQRVCIVNQLVADFFFSGQTAIGQYLRLPQSEPASIHDSRSIFRDRASIPEKCRIVGVVENAKYASLWQDAPPTIYFPVNQDTPELENLVFLLRGKSQAQVMAAYHTALSRQAPEAPLNTFLPLQTQIEESIWAERLFTSLSSILCAVSLFLAAVGLFSLLSSRARTRRKELALRLTMGAQRRDLLCMVLGEAGLVVLPGILLGTAATMGVRHFIATWTPDAVFDYIDPVRRLLQSSSLPMLALPLFILVLVFLWAALVPASRAASTDPALLLRSE